MKPSVDSLLSALPVYQDEWIRIKDEQTVDDIISSMLLAHEKFAPQYDKISSFFNSGTDQDIFENLYWFCKDNLRYQEESEDDQNTMTPAGILIHGSSVVTGIDCKHYAGFIGGVLDAINRKGRKPKINWCYRFASYKPQITTPHHVFVVVKKGNEEIYIDPTPMAEGLQPFWIADEKISAHTNIGNMALSMNIAGAGVGNQEAPVKADRVMETFEIPKGADLVWQNGQWMVSIPHSIMGVSIGQTDLIATGLALISNITSLFGSGGPSSRAAQKIFQMFPLPARPTTLNMIDLISAIEEHENNDVGLDSEWIAAFTDIKTQYGHLLDVLKAGGTTLPPIVVPPIGAGSPPISTTFPGNVYTGLPGTYPPAPTQSSNFLTNQTIVKGLPNWIILVGGGAAAFYFFKKKRRA